MKPMLDVFVLGLLDWQRKALESINHAEQYRFHSLLSWEEVVATTELGFDELLERARRQLNRFGGKPAAIICHWDFPSSCLAPVLAKEYGLPAPSLESVLKCEHKYWARLEQQKVVPECVPGFQVLDPFNPDAADQLTLDFPIWLKPVKGFSSQLGFHIKNDTQLRAALEEMRKRIGVLGERFDECLRHATLPAEAQGTSGHHALAESIISGSQFAPEGYVLNNEVRTHGLFDMGLEQGGKAISYLRYPLELPRDLHDRVNDVCRRVLTQVGFNNGCFNVEFFWDEPKDKLWLIEVNTRISQSHSDLFLKVNGMSNHEVAISVALGQEPRLPDSRGRFSTAGKFILQKAGDARVIRTPTPEEVTSLSRELDDALILLEVNEGDQLSETRYQPEYAYTVAEAWIGANSEEELMSKYHWLADHVAIEFADGGQLSP